MTGAGQMRGAASVEHAALVLLMTLVAGAVIARSRSTATMDRARSLALALEQRCAVRYPYPCWQDPLSEPYGRELRRRSSARAGARRTPRAGWDRAVGFDYRHCRQVSCATPLPGGAGLHLTASNRRTTAFTSLGDAGAGGISIDYWIYRPTIGWERITRYVDAAELTSYAGTPLLESADPVLVPLETLLGRDDAEFPAGEQPPWRGEVESLWGV